MSASDCEVIAHAYGVLGVDVVKELDGMFAFVLFEHASTTKDSRPVAFAARDPTGIKPLYMGRAAEGGGEYMFASELKALVGFVDPSTVKEMPPGHYWTPETGLVRYFKPQWLVDESFAPWETGPEPTDEEVFAALDKAVSKRMMSDVEYGFLLSGGVDSCIVGSLMAPRW